jgi:ethanolamine utilization protein EutN
VLRCGNPSYPFSLLNLLYIARVVGDVIATHRHANLGGHKLLLVRRLGLGGEEEGGEVIALDVIGVGIGERVLIVQEGNAARSLFKSDKIPAQAVVVGVVDTVQIGSGTEAASSDE